MINLIKSILRFIRSAILITLLVSLVIFMVNNRTPIDISFSPLPYKIETRIFLVMIFFFVFGMLFGFLAFSRNMLSNAISGFRTKRQLRKLEKQVKR